MDIKVRLTIINFLQFFVWGAWLITLANYWFGTRQWDGTQFGTVFATMGIASLFMPTLIGIIADRWVNAEKLYALLHVCYAGTLVALTQVDNPQTFFTIMLLAMCFYMPTLALSNSIAYYVLSKHNLSVVKAFPPIRVWGTIGFIAAMWTTNLSGSKSTIGQFMIAAVASIALAAFSILALPKVKSGIDQKSKQPSWSSVLGLDAFKLFANYKMALFFIFCMFLGAALQLTNAYGDIYIDDFKYFPKYANLRVIKYSTIIMSISQISETVFILAIPFFLQRYGIKKVILISMVAWVLRFGLFAFGDPDGGLWMIILSCIVYGLAFDFFNISGSLFAETSVPARIRSSAQGLFMMMTNGIGAIFGSITSGWLIDNYFTKKFTSVHELAQFLETSINNAYLLETLSLKGISIKNGLLSSPIYLKDWPAIWISFSLYVVAIAILFALLFKHKHEPSKE